MEGAEGRGPHLKVRHVLVALLGAGVVGQLDVPEAGHLVNQEGVLFDHRVEDVLQGREEGGVRVRVCESVCVCVCMRVCV